MHWCAIWLVIPAVTLSRRNYIFEWLTDCKYRRNRIGIYAFRAESKSCNKLSPYFYETKLQVFWDMMPCRLGNCRRRFGGAHFVSLHVLCILRLHIPEDLKLREHYCENLQVHVDVWAIPLLNTGPLYLHVLSNVSTVRFVRINCLVSKPTINAPILHITLHYVLTRVSAHVSAIFRESRLTLRFSAYIWL